MWTPTPESAYSTASTLKHTKWWWDSLITKILTWTGNGTHGPPYTNFWPLSQSSHHTNILPPYSKKPWEYHTGYIATSGKVFYSHTAEASMQLIGQEVETLGACTPALCPRISCIVILLTKVFLKNQDPPPKKTRSIPSSSKYSTTFPEIPQPQKTWRQIICATW